MRSTLKLMAVVVATVLVGSVATLAMNYSVLLSVMARDVFHIGSQGYGVLMASVGVGSVLAGLALSAPAATKNYYFPEVRTEAGVQADGSLTVDEFLSWQFSIDQHGLAGLRTTRLQQYR